MLEKMSVLSGLQKGLQPKRSQKKITPRDHMSISKEQYLQPAKSQGARQFFVTTQYVLQIVEGSTICLDRPKSQIPTLRPSGSIMMFFEVRSRWRNFQEWRNQRASRSWRMTARTAWRGGLVQINLSRVIEKYQSTNIFFLRIVPNSLVSNLPHKPLPPEFSCHPVPVQLTHETLLQVAILALALLDCHHSVSGPVQGLVDDPVHAAADGLEIDNILKSIHKNLIEGSQSGPNLNRLGKKIMTYHFPLSISLTPNMIIFLIQSLQAALNLTFFLAPNSRLSDNYLASSLLNFFNSSQLHDIDSLTPLSLQLFFLSAPFYSYSYEQCSIYPGCTESAYIVAAIQVQGIKEFTGMSKSLWLAQCMANQNLRNPTTPDNQLKKIRKCVQESGLNMLTLTNFVLNQEFFYQNYFEKALVLANQTQPPLDVLSISSPVVLEQATAGTWLDRSQQYISNLLSAICVYSRNVTVNYPLICNYCKE